MIDQPTKTNYYDVLNVQPDATPGLIRQSYRRLMQTEAHHPDLGGNTDTAALINKAYAVLSDPQQRTEYDARRYVLSFVAGGMGDRVVMSSPERQTPDPSRECVFCATPHVRPVVANTDLHCETCGSPLAVANARRIERWDKRAVGRVPKQLPLRYFVNWRQTVEYDGHTEDISLSGLRFRSKRPVFPPQHLRLVSDRLEAVARVVRCTPRRTGWKIEYLIGVHFVTLRMLQSKGGFISDRC